jgi:hypothetical protein
MSRFIVCLIVCLSVSSAWSQTLPTTQAGVSVDQSTPRGTLKVLTSAMESGDGAKIRAVFQAETPLEEQMATAMSQMAEAIVKMRKAALAKFKENAVSLTGDPTALFKELARLDTVEETIEGDTAKVTPNANGKPIVMRRVGDDWKIPISEIAKNADQAQIESKLRQYQMMIKVTNEFADDILANKYKTGDEASQAYNGRITRASAEGTTTAPTTGPTTMPAR